MPTEYSNFHIHSEEVKNTLLFQRKSNLKNNFCNKIKEKAQHRKKISHPFGGILNKSEPSEDKHDTSSQKYNCNLNDNIEEDQYNNSSNHYNDEK